MSERIHDDEPDTGEAVVRALLATQCPQWAQAPVSYLQTSGTDNAMWRVSLEGEPDVVARLPRRPGAAAGVTQEVSVLRQIGVAPIGGFISTPVVRHLGQPQPEFPYPWSVLQWIDGSDAWTGRRQLAAWGQDRLSDDLAHAVSAIGALAIDEVSERSPGSRGGPLAPLIERLNRWLDDPHWNAADLVDVAAVRRLADEGLEVVDEPVAIGFVHGDLIPGNLLVRSNRLTAIIDWGGAGRGDLAQDLAPAWAVLTASERPRFRAAVGVDDATWIRGRTIELEHAVGGLLYYVPKQHPLGTVMSRTLDRILDAP